MVAWGRGGYWVGLVNPSCSPPERQPSRALGHLRVHPQEGFPSGLCLADAGKGERARGTGAGEASQPSACGDRFRGRSPWICSHEASCGRGFVRAALPEGTGDLVPRDRSALSAGPVGSVSSLSSLCQPAVLGGGRIFPWPVRYRAGPGVLTIIAHPPLHPGPGPIHGGYMPGQHTV